MDPKGKLQVFQTTWHFYLHSLWIPEGNAEDEIDAIPAATMTPAAALDRNDEEDLGDIIPPPSTALNVMVPSNETAQESDLENTELTSNQSWIKKSKPDLCVEFVHENGSLEVVMGQSKKKK